MTRFAKSSLGTLAALALSLSVGSNARGDEDTGLDLVGVARAGARPKECGGASRARQNRWDRAKQPGLERYCDTLARGYGKLTVAPKDALVFAAEAARLMPKQAAPRVLAGRAKVALSDYPSAFTEFESALAASRSSLDAPGALHAFAISAEKTGHFREALGAYRELAPRAELFDDAGEALRVFIEGAFVAMSGGQNGLTEAVGYLNEARRMPALPELENYLLGALALALDRQGRHSEAAGIAAEAAGPWQLEDDRADIEKRGLGRPVLPEGEIDAMIAILAERRDRELALERWQSYLDSPAGKGPFAAHARARRDALKRRGGR